MDKNIVRPYLVVPKLIEQPRWGGSHIVETKQWQDKPKLTGKKIGQSYELYDKSNLSLATSSDDPTFIGEIADNKIVEQQTTAGNSIALTQLITQNPAGILGKRIVDTFGPAMHLLLKYTQALGNSFQLHIPEGTVNPRWKAKPESWYYFEPGLITCGVKEGVNWDAYQAAVTKLDSEIQTVATRVRNGSLLYEEAQKAITELIKASNPWQYVNLVRVEKGTLLDLSPCGIHHSWEEDLATIPLGNVLYEIQLNVMDDVATIRSFDKGKLSPEGKLRPLQIDDYFTFVDRSKQANDPRTHMREAQHITQNEMYSHDRILETKYYSMDRIRFRAPAAEFAGSIDTFRHLFVKNGEVDVVSNTVSVHVGQGHSAFIPANCQTISIKVSVQNTEVLISY